MDAKYLSQREEHQDEADLDVDESFIAPVRVLCCTYKTSMRSQVLARRLQSPVSVPTAYTSSCTIVCPTHGDTPSRAAQSKELGPRIMRSAIRMSGASVEETSLLLYSNRHQDQPAIRHPHR
jgi:hypothetical protein